MIEPENLSFGQVKRDSPAQRQTIKVKKADAGPLNPKVQSIDNKQITATLKEVRPGEEYDLEVEVAPPWPTTGLLQGLVRLETGIERIPTQDVRVYATVAPRVHAMPRQFVIQNPPTEETNMEARVVWDGASANLTEVKVNAPQFTASVATRPEGQFVILHVPADLEAKGVRGLYQVTVNTDDPETPQFQIPIFVMRPNVGRGGPGSGKPSSGAEPVLMPAPQTSVEPRTIRPAATPAPTPPPTTAPSAGQG